MYVLALLLYYLILILRARERWWWWWWWYLCKCLYYYNGGIANAKERVSLQSWTAVGFAIRWSREWKVLGTVKWDSRVADRTGKCPLRDEAICREKMAFDLQLEFEDWVTSDRGHIDFLWEKPLVYFYPRQSRVTKEKRVASSSPASYTLAKTLEFFCSSSYSYAMHATLVSFISNIFN